MDNHSLELMLPKGILTGEHIQNSHNNTQKHVQIVVSVYLHVESYAFSSIDFLGSPPLPQVSVLDCHI